MDETSFSQRPPIRRTWAPRGQTPIIEHHFNWNKLTATGSIYCRPDGREIELLLHFQRSSTTAESILGYLQALHEQIPGPITLLWDGLTSHRSKIVQEYIIEQKGWLIVERFPSYAPELNPVEYLWSSTKGKDVANFCPDNLGQIEQKMGQAADRIRSEQGLLAGFLKKSRLFDNCAYVIRIAKYQ